MAQTEARQTDRVESPPTTPPSYRTLWRTCFFGIFAAGAGFHFAYPDPISLIFVSSATLVFCVPLFTLWSRLRVSPAYAPANGSSPDTDRILQLVGEHGLRAPDKSAALRMSPNEALRICPQLVNDAVQLGGLQHVQALLISLGLVGTFVGLSMGLQSAVPCIDPNDAGFEACKTAAIQALGEAGEKLTDAEKPGAAMQRGMSALLGGARLAFSKSIAGVGLGVLYLFALRNVEGQLRRRRRSFVLSVLNRCEVRTSDDVMREHLTHLVATLATQFKASMSDQTALTAAASSLSGAAQRIDGSVNKLSAAATNLGGLSADAIGEKVGLAMDRTVAVRLQPALDRIGQQLVTVKQLVEQVEQYKAANDKEVSERLAQLTAALRDEVLLPMSAEVQRASEQTRLAAKAINDLAPVIKESTAATAAAAAATQMLGRELEHFQGETQAQLEKYSKEQAQTLKQAGDAIKGAVDAAVVGLKEQEAAFKQAAALAERSFIAQAAGVALAGKKSAEAIEAAGTEASHTFRQLQAEQAASLEAARQQQADARKQQQAALVETQGAIRQVFAEGQAGLATLHATVKASTKDVQSMFAAQTDAVRVAGSASETAIRGAGEAARDVLKQVQDELVGGIQAQLGEMRKLLAGLKDLSSTFNVTDSAQRDAVLQLAEQTSKTLTELHKVSRAVQGTSEASSRERRELQEHLDEVVTKHGALLRTESAALAQALDQLYQAVNAAELVNQRAAQLNPQPQVGRRVVGPAGGPNG